MHMAGIVLHRRQTVKPFRRLVNIVLFVLLGFAFSSIFILALGFHPIDVFMEMITYSFFNLRGIRGSIMAGLPLMLCGLSVSVSYRMNLNNIGAEGQFAVGALLGGAFALYGPKLPAPLGVIALFVLCALGGCLWALIAAVLKAFWNISETIVTLMLNYIALYLMDYLCYGPWMQKGQTTPITRKFSRDLFLPLLGKSGISSGVFVAVILAVLLYLFFRYTTMGFQVEVSRNSLRAAEYAGIDIRRNILIVLGLSGAIAGAAGFVQTAGVLHRVQAQLPGGSGYTGIVIAFLSGFNPLAVIVVSILLGGLDNSCSAVQIMGVPSQIATMIQGSIMIFVIAGEFFNRYRISFRRSARDGTAPGRADAGRRI